MTNNNRIYIFFLSLMVFSCANPQPPSGGPPDKTPPEIVKFSPANGSLNFKEDGIVIEFSKWMERTKVIENVFISPTVKLDFDWSGKELEIQFGDSLRENTTYSLTLGADYADIYQNKPESGFSIVFSTGSHLDSGYIEGKIFDKNPSGAYIFAYKIDGINADTLNPSHTKPDYRIQSGTSGNFRIQALKDGVYRLFAVRDKFKDELINDAVDEFSAAPYDIKVFEGKPDRFLNIKIGPPPDNTGPMLYGVEQITKWVYAAEFSENINPRTIKMNSLVLTDSISVDTFKIAAVYQNPDKPSKVNFFVNDTLPAGITLKLLAHKGLSSSLADSSGNSMNDSLNFKYFKSFAINDSMKFEFKGALLPDSSNGVEKNKAFEFLFNYPIVSSEIRESVKLLKMPDSTFVEYNVDLLTGNRFFVEPVNSLNSYSWYRLSVDWNKIRAFYGESLADTITDINFQTADTRNFGYLSGTVIDSMNCSGNINIVLIAENGKTYQVTAGKDGKWAIESIPEGNYSVEIYCQPDLHSKYSFGNTIPFKHSNIFFVSDKKIQVKPRWKVEGVVLVFPG